jgi:hypothetical protein
VVEPELPQRYCHSGPCGRTPLRHSSGDQVSRQADADSGPSGRTPLRPAGVHPAVERDPHDSGRCDRTPLRLHRRRAHGRLAPPDSGPCGRTPLRLLPVGVVLAGVGEHGGRPALGEALPHDVYHATFEYVPQFFQACAVDTRFLGQASPRWHVLTQSVLRPKFCNDLRETENASSETLLSPGAIRRAVGRSSRVTGTTHDQRISDPCFLAGPMNAR